MNVVYVCNDCHRLAESDQEAFMEYIKIFWPAIYKWHIEHKNDPPQTITCVTLQDNIDQLRMLIDRLGATDGVSI